MRVAAALAIVLTLAGPAAGEVAGQNEPAFVAAMARWLEADEATSLPAMAGLAAGGNGAARLLLGVIDSSPAMQGAWLQALERSERIALLRQPGGLSGRNWLVDQAATDPIAEAWTLVWDGYARPEVLLRLARLEEPRAALVAGNMLASRDPRGFGDLVTDPDFPDSLMVYAILDWQRRDPDQAAAALAELAVGDPQRALLLADKDSPDAVADWLASHPEGDPVVALCAALCPDEEPGPCRSSALAGLGGYHGLTVLGAPVEALVTSTAFNRSPKGIEVTRRRIAPEPHTSACLATALKM